MKAVYSGKGFEHFTAGPSTPLWIPGELRALTVRYKISDRRYALKVDFNDGWGRDQVDGKHLSWDMKTDLPGEWRSATFQVPPDWVQPVRIAGITTHNWEAQNVENTVRILIDDIEVDTDLARVDQQDRPIDELDARDQPREPARALKECPPTPLVSVMMTTGQESNIFTRTAPEVRIRLQNWKPGALTGKLSCQLLDNAGQSVDQFERPVSVESSASLAAPLKLGTFGRFTLRASVALSDGTERAEQLVLARLPAEHELTPGQKRTSPYGINVHSGDRVVLSPFRKAGIVWFREYAFTYEWLLRAKGDDGRYAGWPDYRRIIERLRGRGSRLPAGHPEVDRAPQDRGWPAQRPGRARIANGPGRSAASSMPSPRSRTGSWTTSTTFPPTTGRRKSRSTGPITAPITGNSPTSSTCWAAARFVAVENGRAGIWPQRVSRCVRSGDFEHIVAVNSHHYCGTDAPEVNLSNFNMGTESKEPRLLFDELRAVKRAARADGKDRQSWLTEFGWDTLAGPVVSDVRAGGLPAEGLDDGDGGRHRQGLLVLQFRRTPSQAILRRLRPARRQGPAEALALRDGGADERAARPALSSAI